jgi:molybdate transport system substrate-binding protein
MKLQPIVSRAAALGLAGILLLAGAVQAAEIRVVSSGGFAAGYRALAPEFEHATGNTLVTEWGPSMGNTVNAVPARLRRGEPIDVVIMVGYALEDLIQQGKVFADSRVDLARSGIGAAVRAGGPKPDIGSVHALRRTLLAAKSIAYSDSASGVYIQNVLLKRLGIADQVAGKARMIPAEPVGAVVARGEAEIGFQQISELKPIPGIEVVGPLPPEVQKYTVFSAGIVTGSREPEAATALIKFLASPVAAPAIRESGMEPMMSVGHGAGRTEASETPRSRQPGRLQPSSTSP